MLNEIVAEQAPVPVLELGLHHMDMMGSIPVLVAFNEPDIERRVWSPQDGCQK